MTSPEAGSSSAAVATVGKQLQLIPTMGHFSFPCRDCNLTFRTYQALGGHRKLHTKTLDPNQKPRRRQRRRIPIFAALAATPAAAEISQKPPEKEEWNSVKVQISDQGLTGGSKTGGKFIEFMETRREQSSAVPVTVETPAAGIIEELDLTLHL